MKKFSLVIIFTFIHIISNSQIVLEQEITTNPLYGAFFVKLNDGASKYYYFDNQTLTIRIYNSNNSLFQTTNVIENSLYNPSNFYENPDLTICCVSDQLFDSDNNIEFMALIDGYDINGNNVIKTAIIDDDGSILFLVNNQKPTDSQESLPNYPSWIANTENGTKMILVSEGDDWENNMYIYSLPGTVPSLANNEIPLKNINGRLRNYPNPAKNYTIIEYQIPKNESLADIVVYNMNGQEVKRFKIDNHANYLQLSTDDLTTGTYFYNLQTSTFKSEGKKMVIEN